MDNEMEPPKEGAGENSILATSDNQTSSSDSNDPSTEEDLTVPNLNEPLNLKFSICNILNLQEGKTSPNPNGSDSEEETNSTGKMYSLSNKRKTQYIIM